MYLLSDGLDLDLDLDGLFLTSSLLCVLARSDDLRLLLDELLLRERGRTGERDLWPRERPRCAPHPRGDLERHLLREPDLRRWRSS